MSAQLLDFERSGAPLYLDIAKQLHAELLRGTWRPGEQIPTESELEKRFGVSRGTVRAAVAELTRAQLLERQPGRGTFVLAPQFTASFSQFFSYERKNRDGPLRFDTSCLVRRVIKAPPRHAAALRVTPGAAIAHVRRLRSQAGEPIVVEDSFFPMSIWHRIANADFTVTALYEEIRLRFDVHMLSAEEYLTAEFATLEMSRLLSIPRGSPVIVTERRTRGVKDDPAEFRLSVARSDKFRYHARLR